MQPDLSTWNEELIHNLFDKDNASRILSIPISGSSLEDTLVWKIEGSGTYSVRSWYRDQWKAPEAGIVKINFDASFLSKDRIAITAVIARNSTGSILGAETYLYENIEDPFVAEARACERALLFAKAMGFRRLAVEGDALSVIKSIKKRGNDFSVIRSITHNIYVMGLSFDRISYHFTPRAANGVAYALTLEGRRSCYCGVWIHGLPSSVVSIARKEGLQLHLDGSLNPQVWLMMNKASVAFMASDVLTDTLLFSSYLASGY
ncbi:reverse transcriptase [Gossypium australe]|uniref:Reverse transcriptase n=1 Tax=Gossypium australe TaxID=47621 RepID=A0A5B6VKR5_9ROSI|nr:reverse transcriptase [Gossypium australe]